MPAYRFRAAYPSGHVLRGRMMAANENELSHALRESGLELIEAREQPPSRLSALFSAFRKRASLRERALFCSQMRDLLGAGMPFLEALNALAATLSPGLLRSGIDAAARDIRQGTAIAAAFGKRKDLFPGVFSATLRAGEASGDLTGTFGRLAEHLAWQAGAQEQARRALRYPLFLLAVVSAVTMFMMTMVVPRVMDFLATLGASLPFLTRLLIRLSNVFASWWWAGLLAAIAAGSAVFLARRVSGRFALRSDAWLLKLPLAGPLINKFAAARFAHSFALLLNSGMGLPAAMGEAQNVLGNRALTGEASNALRLVLEGQSFSAATRNLFPPHVIQMLRVGERSGRLNATLLDIARHYDADTRSSLEGLIGTLEPALTAFAGLLLAWVVLAVLGPVYAGLGQLNAVP